MLGVEDWHMFGSIALLTLEGDRALLLRPVTSFEIQEACHGLLKRPKY